MASRAHHPLKIYRQQHGITLADLADRVGSTKVSLSRIENRKQWPSLALIFKLKKATKGRVSADDFLPA